MELTLVVDHACNLRCSYCYAGQKRSRPMTQEIARAAVEFALRRDPSGLELGFFGGEPLLGMALIEELTDYSQRRLSECSPGATLVVHLNTNASLVDERVVRYVRGCPSINAFVSLDGPASVHDRHRRDAKNKGSYAATRQGLLKLADAGARMVAAAVINPDTAPELGAVVEEFATLPLVRAHITCNLRANWDEPALAGFRQGLSDATRVWAEHFRSGQQLVLEPFTTKILSHLHGAMPCFRRCQLGQHELVVAPSGHFYACGEMVGDDQDERLILGDVSSGMALDKLAAMAAQKNRIEVTCAPCALRERCSSSCGCKHLALTGNLGQVTDVFCDLEEAIIDAADRIAETLHAERCEAFLDLFYKKRWSMNTSPELMRLRRKELPRG